MGRLFQRLLFLSCLDLKQNGIAGDVSSFVTPRVGQDSKITIRMKNRTNSGNKVFKKSAGKFWGHLFLLFFALACIGIGRAEGGILLATNNITARRADDAIVSEYYAQYLPSPYSPERLPQPGSACYHLNYEGPGGEGWDMERVIQQLARRADCVVIYWQHIHDHDVCVAKSQEVFGLLEKYGIGQIIVRVANLVPGDYIGRIIDGQINDAHIVQWYHGARGIPPGLQGNPREGYVPIEGDMDVGRLYLFSLQSCWNTARVGDMSVAEWMARRLVFVQLYNEVDFEHEWSSPPPNLFTPIGDGKYKIFTGSYYLLGHWVCSLSNGFSWLLLPSRVVSVVEIDGEVFFSYDTNHPRVPVLIPPVGTGNRDDIEDYLNGCLDSFHKLPIPDYPVIGGYYSPFYGGVFGYSAHIYAPCSHSPYSSVDKVVQDIRVIDDIIARYQSGQKFETPVRVFVTEFGCAQVGYSPTRLQQKQLFDAATEHILGTPLAWWIFAGRSCHSPYEPATGSNEPHDWDKMAIVDYRGYACDYVSAGQE